jgi:hypothetical protein
VFRIVQSSGAATPGGRLPGGQASRAEVPAGRAPPGLI